MAPEIASSLQQLRNRRHVHMAIIVSSLCSLVGKYNSAAQTETCTYGNHNLQIVQVPIFNSVRMLYDGGKVRCGARMKWVDCLAGRGVTGLYVCQY